MLKLTCFFAAISITRWKISAITIISSTYKASSTFRVTITITFTFSTRTQFIRITTFLYIRMRSTSTAVIYFYIYKIRIKNTLLYPNTKYEINIKISYLIPYYFTWTTVRIAASRLGRRTRASVSSILRRWRVARSVSVFSASATR